MISGNGFGWFVQISLCSMAAAVGCRSASGGTHSHADMNTPCAIGYMRCGPHCVDVQADFNNCGACGKMCDAPRACILGICGGPDMVPAREPVQANNADVTADAAVNGHLASAENTIPTVTLEVAKTDGGDQNAPQETDANVGTTCGNRKTDVNNCGECGFACSTFHAINVRCERGKCVRDKCEPGWADCDDMSGCETDIRTPQNCGRCGHVCQSIKAGDRDVQLACTNGACGDDHYSACGTPNDAFDLRLDASNCGRCGRVCGKYELCKNGTCVCNDVGMCDKPKRASPPKKK